MDCRDIVNAAARIMGLSPLELLYGTKLSQFQFASIEMKLKIVFFDLETTGLNTNSCEILSIGKYHVKCSVPEHCLTSTLKGAHGGEYTFNIHLTFNLI